MTADERLRMAQDQLALVLSFFGRVETKLSVILGIDLAMLGFLASRFPGAASVSVGAWIAVGIFLVLGGLSLVQLYHGSFPQLEGGNASLIYFREIAKRTEVKFVEEFNAASVENLAKDVSGQVWRNSQILSQKFDHSVWAYRFMALSVIPWVVAIVLFSK